MKKSKLDRYEKSILDSYNKGEWKSVGPLKSTLAKHKQIAANTFAKNKRINIRLSKNDLDGVRNKAAEEGIPYQTLIASVIHKYLSGRLRAA